MMLLNKFMNAIDSVDEHYYRYVSNPSSLIVSNLVFQESDGSGKGQELVTLSKDCLEAILGNDANAGIIAKIITQTAWMGDILARLCFQS